MNRSGRGGISSLLGTVSSGVAQTSDMEQRRQGLSASVWCDAEWKKKATHLAAPPATSQDAAEDGEEYMCGLAEEIAQSMLEENEQSWSLSDSPFEHPEAASWGTQVLLSTSPQSTLAGMSSWDVLSPGASSNGGTSSGVSSPSTPVEASQGTKDEEDALDLLYAELLRLKMEDELKVRQQQLLLLKQQQHYQQLLWKLRQREVSRLGNGAFEVLRKAQSIVQYTKCSSNQVSSSDSGCNYRSKLRSDNDFNQDRNRSQVSGLGGGYAPLQSICSKATAKSWSAIEQSNQGHSQYNGRIHSFSGSQHNKCLPVNRSGMRAVFLGMPGARESGGTGVFFPRRVGNSHESKQKPACSTVLLPSRIVQALNLNVEDTLACSANPTPFSLRRGVSGGHLPARVRASASPVSRGGEESSWGAGGAALQEVAPDVCLPREWTY